MKRSKEREASWKQTVAFWETYNNVLKLLNTKYSIFDVGMTSFFLWEDLGQELIAHGGKTREELRNHLKAIRESRKEDEKWNGEL